MGLTALGSSVGSAAFSGGAGTVNVAGTLYAKSGGALTLTVSTSSDTKCVEITGAFAARQTRSHGEVELDVHVHRRRRGRMSKP